MNPAAGAWPALAGALAAAFAGCLLVLAWLVWGLPRLARTQARLCCALGVAALGAAALLWPALHALLLPAVALLFGHLGRELGPWAVRLPRRSEPAVAASQPASAGPSTLPGQPSRRLPGTLGRYRVDSEIGRGSMGAVYLGHDPQIGRKVAIKTLALGREFHGEQLLEARSRFFREAETAGRLQHPDIVTIFDAGETGELAWIAMEFIQGHDLQRYTVLRRLLPLASLLPVVARVADALAYAHRQGVVHRDIKPANVMVDPDTGLVKVMDFGVARMADATSTRTGMVIGTPSFMSPEQMAGRPADRRSDLYSLGVMLFQLLTGRLPHEADSMARLMQQIAQEPAPDVRTLRPDVPEALADIVALALEKRVEVRYADGQQLAEDLRAVHASLLIEPPDPFERTVTLSRDDPRHNSMT